MNEKPNTDHVAMSGNVQGFELPTGCLMTSVFILIPVLALLSGLIR